MLSLYWKKLFAGSEKKKQPSPQDVSPWLWREKRPGDEFFFLFRPCKQFFSICPIPPPPHLQKNNGPSLTAYEINARGWKKRLGLEGFRGGVHFKNWNCRGGVQFSYVPLGRSKRWVPKTLYELIYRWIFYPAFFLCACERSFENSSFCLRF